MNITPATPCYAELKGDQWQAFSIKYGLAVQGDTFEEVQQKLESMIDDYIHDVFFGEDAHHSIHFLCHRPASLKIRMKYRFYATIWRYLGIASDTHIPFYMYLRDPFDHL